MILEAQANKRDALSRPINTNTLQQCTTTITRKSRSFFLIDAIHGYLNNVWVSLHVFYLLWAGYIQGVRIPFLYIIVSFFSFYLVSTSTALRTCICIVYCSAFHYTHVCVCVHVFFIHIYTVSLRSFRMEIALFSRWRERIVLLASTIHHHITSSQSSFSIQVW